MKFLIKVIVIFIIVVSFRPFILAQVSTDYKIIKDNEKIFQVSVPDSWKHLELNDEATIQVGNESDETYFILLSESKDDFVGWNIEKHSRITLAQLLISVSFPKIEGPVYTEINDYEAVQYKLSGAVQGINAVYLHTTVESENYFSQLLVWTLKSRYSKNEKLLKNVVNSFKVIGE